MHIRFVVIIGPDEEAQGQVTIKDLKTHTQETIDRGEAGRYLASQQGV